MFDRVRETTWTAIAVVLTLQVASSFFMNAVVFQGAVRSALGRLHRATGGLIEPNVIANLVPLTIVVGLGIFVIARLRPSDLGLTQSALPLALGATAGFWLVVQAAFVLLTVARGDTLNFHPAWTDPGAGYVVGGLLGQFFGNALAEEAVFRGFLFPQLLLKLRRRFSGRTAVGLAALASQVAFAVLHIPNRLLVKGFDLGFALAVDQTLLIVHGLVFLALFVGSRNLLVAVGVHALWNDLAPVIEPPGGVGEYLTIVGFTVALAALLYVLRLRFSTSSRRGAA